MTGPGIGSGSSGGSGSGDGSGSGVGIGGSGDGGSGVSVGMSPACPIPSGCKRQPRAARAWPSGCALGAQVDRAETPAEDVAERFDRLSMGTRPLLRIEVLGHRPPVTLYLDLRVRLVDLAP
jgi:hypothetical protein